LTVAEAPRPRPLAGLPALVAFAAVFAGLLAAVFPTDREYAELASSSAPDSYALAYLQALTRANADDVHLRLQYVRQLASLGRFDQALAALDPTLRDPSIISETRNLRLDLHLSRARALPPGSSERARAFDEVVRDAEELLGIALPPERLRALASLALELEKPALGARFYRKLADAVPAEKAANLALAGKWLRAAGDGRGAAATFVEAAAAERDPAASRADSFAALDALEADDQVCQAADLGATFVRAHGSDVEVLVRVVELATACGQVAVARDLGRRLLELSTDDDDLAFAQARRELAAGDVHAALAIIHKLVLRHPADLGLREVEGRVAEWAGQPDLALGDWLFLLGHGPGGSKRFSLK
jgi:hypothetical protein